MKTFYKILAMLAFVLCFAGTALAAEKEVSSIDAIDMGVADTGETHFTNTDAEITECTQPYTVAVLPYVDVSGLEGRSREMAVNAVKEALETKYPGKKNLLPWAKPAVRTGCCLSACCRCAKRKRALWLL